MRAYLSITIQIKIMDSGTLITGLIAVFFCALPFVFVMRNNQKQKRALQNLLFQLAATHNHQIGYFEQWNNTAIGINTEENVVYYVKNGRQAVSEQIKLAEVENCFVSNDKKGKDGMATTQRITLNFKLKNKDGQRSWAFYDNLIDPVLPANELELAKKWEKQLSNKLIN
jgi:hypothetical protein